MKSLRNEAPVQLNVASVLDDVCMSAQERKIAKDYLQKTEAALDLIWLASAKIRDVFAHGSSKNAPVAIHQP